MLGMPLSAIRATRPAMTLYPRAVIEAVLLSEGPIGTAQAVARELGLPNRFKLARLLKREGLPPLHRLAGWATVLSWVISAERKGVSLCWIAFRSRRHPSACYRLVSGTAPQLLAVHELGFAPESDTYIRGRHLLRPPGSGPSIVDREVRLFVHHNTVQTGGRRLRTSSPGR